MTDMLTNHARALALRGKLIGAGFDPLTVAWDADRARYVIELPIEQFDYEFDHFLNYHRLSLHDWLETIDKVTITVSESEAQP